MKKYRLFFAVFVTILLGSLAASRAHAAIFDAADLLPNKSAAAGFFGELLLSDPSSEGMELHGRYGLSDDWNVAAILGLGSKNKRARFGAETVYSFIPDYDGQIGLSALASAMYVKRLDGGGLQLRAAPMAHKRLQAWNDRPAILYVALPFYIEGKHGTYTTGSQLVLGSLLDISSSSRSYLATEVGIRLAKAESYILAGFGFRFGEVRLPTGSNNANNNASSTRSSPNRRKPQPTADGGPEYTDEDFQ